MHYRITHEFVRQSSESPYEPAPYVLKHSDPAIGRVCAACLETFDVDDVTTAIPIGPGEIESERSRCRDGSVYEAVAIVVHWVCMTGRETR